MPTIKVAKTALDLTPQEWAKYNPVRVQARSYSTLEQQAWQVAREIAKLLRGEFGASRVVLFGSLAHTGWFTSDSDLDLAVWDIQPSHFYRAMARATNLSLLFQIDLVDIADCYPSLQQVIIKEGIEL